MPAKSWKVAILPVGEKGWIENSMRFPTKEDALAYGRDLAKRYPEMVRWGVFESQDQPNTVVEKTVVVLFKSHGGGNG